MHRIQITPELTAALVEMDCWTIQLSYVERLAKLLNGNLNIPVLRRGKMVALVGNRRVGGQPSRFVEEFRELSNQCARLRSDDPESTIVASAFFHLRFEGIHPLIDKNGRVGRLIMAEQLRRHFGGDLQAFIDAMLARESTYRAIDMRQPGQNELEQLTRLVADSIKVFVSEIAIAPFPLTPLFLDNSTNTNSPLKASTQTKPTFKLHAQHTALQDAMKPKGG